MRYILENWIGLLALVVGLIAISWQWQDRQPTLVNLTRTNIDTQTFKMKKGGAFAVSVIANSEAYDYVDITFYLAKDPETKLAVPALRTDTGTIEHIRNVEKPGKYRTKISCNDQARRDPSINCDGEFEFNFLVRLQKK